MILFFYNFVFERVELSISDGGQPFPCGFFDSEALTKQRGKGFFVWVQ